MTSDHKIPTVKTLMKMNPFPTPPGVAAFYFCYNKVILKQTGGGGKENKNKTASFISTRLINAI